MEKGKLEKLEVTLFEKAKRIQEIETHREIWMSLLKGLPTLLIVTLIAVVTTVAYSSQPSQLASVASAVSITAFISILILWSCALIATSAADKRLLDLRNQSSSLKSKVDSLRRTAIEMFQQYKSRMMPSVSKNLYPSYLGNDDGILSEGLISKWRTAITIDRQYDMNYVDESLVSMMDALQNLSIDFLRRFNEFSEPCFKEMNELMPSSNRGTERADSMKSGVIAFYSFYSGLISSSSSLKDPDIYRFVDGSVVRFFDAFHFFDEDSKMNLLKKRTDLTKKAVKARESQMAATVQYDILMNHIKYHYSAET